MVWLWIPVLRHDVREANIWSLAGNAGAVVDGAAGIRQGGYQGAALLTGCVSAGHLRHGGAIALRRRGALQACPAGVQVLI